MNGFFGMIQGPFNTSTNLITLIKEQCGNPNVETFYIQKIGFHYTQPFDLDVKQANNSNIWWRPIIKISIDGKTFQIGKTGMLELQDVKITDSIFFLTAIDDNMYIDYQYRK